MKIGSDVFAYQPTSIYTSNKYKNMITIIIAYDKAPSWEGQP
jgi:hypothetical protein